MKNEYAMCCETPLISTIIFRGAEYFCKICKNTYGLFGVPDRADKTPELEKQFKNNTDWFYKISVDIMADGGMRLDNCKTCKENYEAHTYHATDVEWAKHKKAKAKLGL